MAPSPVYLENKSQFPNGVFASPTLPKPKAGIVPTKTSALEGAIDVRFGPLADVRTAKKSCPLYTQKRTCAVQLGMSALCQ